MSNDLGVTDAKLDAVRDLLLPGLHARAAECPNIDLDIEVDRGTKSLLVKGFNRVKNRSLGFAITTASIADRLYLDSFKPCLTKLIELLNQEAEPVGT